MTELSNEKLATEIVYSAIFDKISDALNKVEKYIRLEDKIIKIKVHFQNIESFQNISPFINAKKDSDEEHYLFEIPIHKITHFELEFPEDDILNERIMKLLKPHLKVSKIFQWAYDYSNNVIEIF